MQTKKYTPVNDREKRMWGYMNRHPHFQYSDVMKSADVSRHHMDCFAGKLRHLGLLKPLGQRGKGRFFTVMDDAAAQAYATEKKGKREGPIWTAMRSLKSFSPPELLLVIGEEHAAMSEDDIQRYCTLLLKADYLAVIQKARPDVNPARYQLVNDSGPLPPIKRNLEVVVDQNTDKAVYASGARI